MAGWLAGWLDCDGRWIVFALEFALILLPSKALAYVSQVTPDLT